MLRIHQEILEAVVAHARQDHPDEACGYLAGASGSDTPTRHIPMTNAQRSSTRYGFDSMEDIKVFRELEQRGEEKLVIYHSHTATPAEPSRSDISEAYEPEAHYLIVSTREPETTEVRSFRIVDGVATEEPVQVIGATADGTAVQSYKFGHTPTSVEYECWV